MRGVILMLVGASSAAAQADNLLENGSFEDGLNGYTATGEVEAVNSELSRDFLPPVREDWEATDGDAFASIWSTDGQSVNVSSLEVTFEAEAGFELSFDYFFDFGDVAPEYDSASGVLSRAGGDDVVLFEHNTMPGNQLDSSANVEWTQVSVTLMTAGTYTLTFTAGDANGSFESILGVDNIVLIPGQAAAVTLLSGLAMTRRSRRRC
jgi:hypothetical protein